MLQELPREHFRAPHAKANQALFPNDPFTEHDARSIGGVAIERSKRLTYSEMRKLADQFDELMVT